MKALLCVAMLGLLAAPAGAEGPYTEALERLQASGGDVYTRLPAAPTRRPWVFPPPSSERFVPPVGSWRGSYDPGSPTNPPPRLQAPAPGGQMLPTNSRQFGGNRVTRTPGTTASSLHQGDPYLSPLR